MRTIVRTSAKTLLVAAGTAGFFALGAGAANAAVLGDTLPLGDLGDQVPQLLNEGLAGPLDGLASVDPGQVSADPDLQHHSGPETTVLEDVSETPSILEDTANELGGMVGTHQVRPDLVELHGTEEEPATVLMTEEEAPVTLDTGQNTDLTGGLTDLLGAEDVVPMSAPTVDEELAGDLTGDLVTVEGLPELGEPSWETEILPQSAVSELSQAEVTTDPVIDMLPGDLR